MPCYTIFKFTVIKILIIPLVVLTLKLFSKDFISLLDTNFRVFYLLLGCILCIIRDFILFIWLLTTFFTIGIKVDINVLKFRFDTTLLCVIFLILIYWDKKGSKNNFFYDFGYMWNDYVSLLVTFCLFIIKYETSCLFNAFLSSYIGN